MDLSFSIPVIESKGTIDPNQPVKCELMQDISKLRSHCVLMQSKNDLYAAK